jgi:hypothetical protein
VSARRPDLIELELVLAFGSLREQKYADGERSGQGPKGAGLHRCSS